MTTIDLDSALMETDLTPSRELVHMLHLQRKAEIQILLSPVSLPEQRSPHIESQGGVHGFVEYIVQRMA